MQHILNYKICSDNSSLKMEMNANFQLRRLRSVLLLNGNFLQVEMVEESNHYCRLSSNEDF